MLERTTAIQADETQHAALDAPHPKLEDLPLLCQKNGIGVLDGACPLGVAGAGPGILPIGHRVNDFLRSFGFGQIRRLGHGFARLNQTARGAGIGRGLRPGHPDQQSEVRERK